MFNETAAPTATAGNTTTKNMATANALQLEAIIGAPQVRPDVKYLAAFQNAGCSQASGVENGRQISHFMPLPSKN